MIGLTPVVLMARLIVLVIGFPIHEWAHAWSADQMGDETARRDGRLSLNPLAHLDILGALLLLITGFGWARPVPVNPHRMRVAPRTGMALSALAGPVSNFLVAMICAIPFRLGLLDLESVSFSGASLNVETLLWWIAGVSLGLALFNLLPFFPLDGEKVLVGIAPRDWGDWLLRFRPFSPYVLMALVVMRVAGTLIRLLWTPLMVLLFTL